MPIFFDGKSDKKMRRGDTAMELESRFAMSDGSSESDAVKVPGTFK